MRYVLQCMIYLLLLAGSLYLHAQNQETISTVYAVAEGCASVEVSDDSYAYYLRNLPLKSAGTEVRYYNGDTKPSGGIYDRVIDMEIDPVDLQQCADAVMRLRAEFLYQANCYDEIHFNFLSDGMPRYFLEYGNGKTDYRTFRKYMK